MKTKLLEKQITTNHYSDKPRKQRINKHSVKLYGFWHNTKRSKDGQKLETGVTFVQHINNTRAEDKHAKFYNPSKNQR